MKTGNRKKQETGLSVSLDLERFETLVEGGEARVLLYILGGIICFLDTSRLDIKHK